MHIRRAGYEVRLLLGNALSIPRAPLSYCSCREKVIVSFMRRILQARRPINIVSVRIRKHV
jgi:hypothetical protein